MADEVVFPNEVKQGECKDCTYYEPYEAGGTMGYCNRMEGSEPIYLWPPVHETCWCSRFVEQ